MKIDWKTRPEALILRMEAETISDLDVIGHLCDVGAFQGRAQEERRPATAEELAAGAGKMYLPPLSSGKPALVWYAMEIDLASVKASLKQADLARRTLGQIASSLGELLALGSAQK